MSNGLTYPALHDTGVLRAFRGGDLAAMRFITNIGNLGRPDISQLSAMALIADAPDAWERTGLGMFFSWCDIHAVTAKIIRRAQQILESLTPPCVFTAEAAIVAAAAIEHKLPLYTPDPTRFAGVAGLTAIAPY